MGKVARDARASREVVVVVAVPDAQVATVGCRGVRGEVGDRTARLVEIGQMAFGDFDLVLALPRSDRVGDEPQPNVRLEDRRPKGRCLVERVQRSKSQARRCWHA